VILLRETSRTAGRFAMRSRLFGVRVRKTKGVPVALPERTVDAWVTAYVAERVPGALLWAPTQRQIPDYDLATSLPGPGKLFVFENKAPQADKAYHFILSLRQIWNYLRRADLRVRTFYVLPCPPFPTSEVPGAPGAATPPPADLVPRRARTRLKGHQWAPPDGCEEWFRVVPAIELWRHLIRGAPPSLGAPVWRKPTKGSSISPPPGAPTKQTVRATCAHVASLGESLETFMDRLLRCDRPELRIDRTGGEPDAIATVDDTDESPLYQALITFAPASSLAGWSR
jgi:hypothetical protein